MLPSNYRACSILDMRQILESWYDRSTFAIATMLRGEAMHKDIGLLKSWIVHGTGMTNGFKALHHREPV